jgi:glutamine synthetase
VRIPGQVAREKKGYIEDRRPNANADPYVVARLMVETICGAAAKSATVRRAPAAQVGANKVAASKAVTSTTRRTVKKAPAKKTPVKKAARR